MIRRLMFGLMAAAVLMLANGVSIAQSNTKKDIVTTAVEAGSFKTLAAALRAAGLVETLQGKGPFTVFAPTDEAFEKLPKGTVEDLLKPENKTRLAAILKFHVVAGRLFSTDLLATHEVKSLNGGVLTASVTNGAARVNGAGLISTDIDATNGVIHVIDAVLLPPAVPAKGAQLAPATSHQLSSVCPHTGRVMTYRMRASRRR